MNAGELDGVTDRDLLERLVDQQTETNRLLAELLDVLGRDVGDIR